MKRTLLASVLALSWAGASAQSGEPIRIGSSFEMSGSNASLGQMSHRGAEYATEVLNKRGGVLGRQVLLDAQDNGTNPQRAVSQSLQIVRNGGVLLVAPNSTGAALAVSSAVSAKQKVPMCVGAAAGDDLTMKQFQPYVFSTAPSQYMMYRAVAGYAAKQKFKRVGVIAVDTVGGHMGIDAFKEFNKELNPQSQLVVEEYVKAGSQDFTAALNKILAAKPDFVFSIIYGSDIITVSKQGKAIDFFKQIDNQFAMMYDTNTLKLLGDEAVLGTIGYARAPFNYLPRSPEGREFIDRFKARYNQYPSDDATMTYDCIMAWAAAVEKAKSTDADAVMNQIKTQEFSTTRGKFRFGKLDHMGEAPITLGPVVMSKEYDQPVMDIQEVVPGSVARPSDEVVLQSRKGK
ncbi:ABC transporter substrate-binding protein [Pseudorhodoferax sp.]|uniref:ABC transporter substrate-binding protein n=1 Tax=Pseudorhodoferax sp. TaxID=1993553 RepID=UPI0039E295FE